LVLDVVQRLQSSILDRGALFALEPADLAGYRTGDGGRGEGCPAPSRPTGARHQGRLAIPVPRPAPRHVQRTVAGRAALIEPDRAVPVDERAQDVLPRREDVDETVVRAELRRRVTTAVERPDEDGPFLSVAGQQHAVARPFGRRAGRDHDNGPARLLEGADRKPGAGRQAAGPAARQLVLARAE